MKENLVTFIFHCVQCLGKAQNIPRPKSDHSNHGHFIFQTLIFRDDVRYLRFREGFLQCTVSGDELAVSQPLAQFGSTKCNSLSFLGHLGVGGMTGGPPKTYRSNTEPQEVFGRLGTVNKFGTH